VFQGVDAPQLVLVVDENPTTDDVLVDHAIWSANVPAGAGLVTVRWDDGVSRVGDTWLTGELPRDPPQSHTLYVVVEALSAGVLAAVSSAQFFAVGSAPWAVVGTDCADSTTCVNQDEVLVCVDRHCGHLCVSERDCPSCAAGHDCCGNAVEGVRVCIP
jgi:hypothetical protein